MIGMVIVTHGRLAAEFVDALEHIVGPQSNVAAVCIGADDDMERRRADIVACVREVDDGQGVVILTDMFGGTPSNLAISIMGSPHPSGASPKGLNGTSVEVLAGINLPMLVKLSSLRDSVPLADAVTSAQEAGRKYINVASKVLEGG